jgi:hypothetical protein
LYNKYRLILYLFLGSYVIINPINETERVNKIGGEIEHVLFPEHVKHLKSEGIWWVKVSIILIPIRWNKFSIINKFKGLKNLKFKLMMIRGKKKIYYLFKFII